ncbi:MAG: hypothetical protein U0470_04245 [Anaerolineae bacterium]
MPGDDRDAGRPRQERAPAIVVARDDGDVECRPARRRRRRFRVGAQRTGGGEEAAVRGQQRRAGAAVEVREVEGPHAVDAGQPRGDVGAPRADEERHVGVGPEGAQAGQRRAGEEDIAQVVGADDEDAAGQAGDHVHERYSASIPGTSVAQR